MTRCDNWASAFAVTQDVGEREHNVDWTVDQANLQSILEVNGWTTWKIQIGRVLGSARVAGSSVGRSISGRGGCRSLLAE